MATQLGEAFVPIRATLDKLDKDLAGARKKIDGVLAGISAGVAAAVANKGIELMGSAMRTTWETMAEGVEKAADLEAQLDAIGAISGATEEQVAELKKTVLDLGLDPNLKVSAFEAAQAVEELAAGGVALEDIMNGAARGTVALANATGADFAQAATISADAMAIFGIEAKNLEEVVDGVAAVAVQSKFDVNDYAMALAQAGGIAASSGVEFDDFNTTIAAISPLFASGSDAGTSFKVMLQRLIPASNDAKDTMTELGIITEDQGNRFFDAQGNLKDMAEIAGILDEAFSGLSEAQRNEAMSTIFGTDAMRAAVGLMEEGEAGFTDLQTKMADTSGIDAAAQRMGNLSGATEILKGVVEGLQIQYGERLIPKLTELAQKATEFASTHGPAFVDSLAAMSLKVIEFGEIALPPVLGELSTVLEGVGSNLEKINTAAEKTMLLFGSSAEEADKFSLSAKVLEVFLGALTQPIDLVNTVLGFMLDNFNTAIDEVTALRDAVSGLVDNTRSLSDRLSELGAALADMTIPDWLQPGSPPPLAFALGDIREQLERMPDFAGRLEVGAPSFPALAGAGIGGGGNTTNIYIDGIQALTTTGSGGDPLDEALLAAFEVLRQRLKGKR